ncbi:hypothetical protein D187_000004 [Cystobacter fuscus DSM 2262]|uniref:Uncharacterized protein n=1 Tax=Cystobacter fuscus (strain ATCC 25194 / DSM 2262 / NBRC 100088 / M29) TaxID=1242864 RepID=S9PQ39_CYSF2|nr:hypothetical protein D187_000004 [Cystobacter fuscus DSM 2262]
MGEQLLGAARRRFQWFNWTKRWSLGRHARLLLSCLGEQLLGAARRRFQWFNWTKRWSKRGSRGMAEGEGASPSNRPSRWSWR